MSLEGVSTFAHGFSYLGNRLLLCASLPSLSQLMALDWAEYLKHGEVAALLETFTIEMSTDKYKSTFG